MDWLPSKPKLSIGLFDKGRVTPAFNSLPGTFNDEGFL
jgi:hypothetical protein